ncbi:MULTISPECIES: 4-oxalocrotonate tautomerase [Brevibacillus]|jgi:4-oxalocrotonate tautomerase|uniref:Tautomerase n=1 Tax=Brevibacillus borstelensis AK1 TaxID=1300222 RepID=M8D1J0_9BACL|nr:4-oxalocrotonate tautomerase [Brevibacillus borstelensis]EMT50069.1 4-oxalocrotonate tautomerase [Brevibacillus borstelensis AK1]KKX52922.1 4-oxalocrotonate tautomerase [Brevibacillus borstelensis cifa_chp40]MED1885610.1 4-oxalocrotonate tautomerase [Brevibacillus borstelensis]MED2008051.1 4-oxalocrotonate tautomerase [Brevibacillus borstelensis]RNB64071.1 4-oxalocrotonate tautomerase [Brevibacillus borstelensis]
MPIVQIQVLEGRDKQQIARLIASVTEAVVESLEVRPEQVRVIVSEVPPTHWGVGGVTKEKQS